MVRLPRLEEIGDKGDSKNNQNYCLDFCIFCQKANIDLECDGERCLEKNIRRCISPNCIEDDIYKVIYSDIVQVCITAGGIYPPAFLFYNRLDITYISNHKEVGLMGK